jgi:hypothetical protein
MAKLKYGNINVTPLGKIGGVVWTQDWTRVGNKAWGKRNKFMSKVQWQHQSFKAYLADQWAHYLAPRDRAQWNDLVKRLGKQLVQVKKQEREDAKGLTGQHAFIGGNFVRLMSGLDIQTAAPSDFSVQGIDHMFAVLTAPATALITFSPSPLAPGHRLYIYSRIPQAKASNSTKDQMRFLGVSDPGIASPFDAGPLLVGKYGVLRSGNWISLLVAVVRDNGGVKTGGIKIGYPDGHIN